jgi:hypothetical protein
VCGACCAVAGTVEAHTLIMAESTERQEQSYPTPLKKRHRGLTSHLARATCIVPESAPTPRQTTPPKPHHSGVDEEEEPLSQGGTEVSRGEEAVVATPAAAQSSPQSAGVTPAAAAGSSGRRSTCRRRRASEICATSERLVLTPFPALFHIFPECA